MQRLARFVAHFFTVIFLKVPNDRRGVGKSYLGNVRLNGSLFNKGTSFRDLYSKAMIGLRSD